MEEKRVPLMRRVLARRKVMRAALVAVLFLLALRYLLVPGVWWGYSEWALARYEKPPFYDNRATLITLAHNGAYGRERAVKMLRAAAQPEIRFRDTYPADAAIAFPVEALGITTSWEWQVRFEDESDPQVAGHYGALQEYPVWPGSPLPAGTHETVLHVTHNLRDGTLSDPPERGVPKWLDLLPRWSFAGDIWSPTSATTLRYRLPISATVVPASEWDPVEYASSPEMGAAVAASITSSTSYSTSAYRSSSNGERVTFKGTGLLLSFRDIPADFAFRIEYVLPNGEGYPVPHRGDSSADVRITRSDTGSCLIGFEGASIDNRAITLDRLMDVLPAGTHRGKIRLTTDRRATVVDPRLNRVWDGTLEFPVTVAIERVEGE